jgi:hypothetical protein
MAGDCSGGLFCARSQARFRVFGSRESSRSERNPRGRGKPLPYKSVAEEKFKLFGAVGDPEDVIKLLWMARVGVVGAFVLILDVGAGGLHCRPLFSCCVGGAAVDGTTGGLGKSRGSEGWGQRQHRGCREQQQAEKLRFHLGLPCGFGVWTPDKIRRRFRQLMIVRMARKGTQY